MELTLYAGPSGGGWFDLAVRLAGALQGQPPHVVLRVLPGGGLDNPRHVQEGRAQLAMTTDILAHAALRGEPPYPEPMSNVVLVSSTLSTLPSYLLRRPRYQFSEALSRGGLRIAVPERDTADALTFERMLDFFGEFSHSIGAKGGSIVYGNYRTIAKAICEGRVDFLFGATTLPADVIRSIESLAPDLRLDSLPDDLITHFVARFGYRRTTIPVGSYPLLHDVDITTAGMGTVIVGSNALDDRVLAAVRSVLQHVETVPGR